MLYLALFIFIMCIIVGLSIALYYIIPKDELDNSVKEYYINKAIIYFEDEEKSFVSIKTLIKSGYASEKKEFINYGCNNSTSYVQKNNDIIIFHSSCEKYTKDYKVKEG